MVNTRTRADGAENSATEPRNTPRRRGRMLPGVFSRQRITYLASGGLTAVIYCAILALALHSLGREVPYPLLVVLSHLGAVIIVYPWYRLVVFRGSGGSWLGGYLRFYAVGLGFLVASVVGLPLLVELAGLPIMVAQGLIILLSPALSYAVHRAWTFRGRGT
jgi:putative flippase GtrA